jgi:DNA replication licensing factor MCM6
MCAKEFCTLHVDYGHISAKDDELATAIQSQYYRFTPYFRRAVHNPVAELGQNT